MKEYDVIIIGGGLAGLTAALQLGAFKKSVLVIEKNHYPLHKVCGEYLSREVVPYLNQLGIDLSDAAEINKLEISGRDGKTMQSRLPLGGIGISRYALDHRMYQRAEAIGTTFIFQNANEVLFRNDRFRVGTSDGFYATAPVVIGAFGKRSGLDKILKRTFIQHKAPWLGVKAHYENTGFPDDLVGLHSFQGGYAGLSKTETGAVNLCYLANYNSFKRYGNLDSFNEEVVSVNPVLDRFFKQSEPLFKQPLSIAQISFDSKQKIVNHMLMCGDAAGLIHPLCGNGMAMAIESAKMASEKIIRFLNEKTVDRTQLELSYEKAWQKTFGRRLWWGRRLQSLLLNPKLSNLILQNLGRSGYLTRTIISKTHGKPIPA